MKTVWYGTASVGIESEGKKLLLDPYFNRNKKLPCATLEDFAGYDFILLTHNHFDHIVDVPLILKNGNARVFCTKTPAKYLIRNGITEDRITVIAPGMKTEINGFEVEVYRSRHVVFDMATIAHRARTKEFYKDFPEAVKIMVSAVTMPEAGEIVAYHISRGGDDIFILGSLNIDKRTSYPKNVNTLVVPYIGLSDEKLALTAVEMAERFMPKRILVDHYDDSFPPISKHTDIDKLAALMKERFPDVIVDKMEFKIQK